LQGQTSPLTSAVTQGLFFNKHWASLLLAELGYLTPPHVVVTSDEELDGIPAEFETVIFKPLTGSRRVGVVGPVRTLDRDGIRRCFQRCVAQIVSGPRVVLAQQYIEGTTCRINVNHGRATFVLESVRNEIVGDGVSTIADLLARKRARERRYEWPDDDFIDNVLTGSGWTRRDVPAAGTRVIASLDGTEGGTFVDVTDDFDPRLKRQAIALSEASRCAVIGIDAIVDAQQRMWIVDVNAIRPTTGNVRRRAYETIEHMVTSLLRGTSPAPAGAVLTSP
jgi:hypothetical protein